MIVSVRWTDGAIGLAAVEALMLLSGAALLSLASALRRLADDPVARRQMGARAAAFARERYGWDTIAPVMSRLYAGLL